MADFCPSRAYRHKISRMDPDSCRYQWVSQDVWWGEEAIDWILPLRWVPRQKRTPWCSSNLGTNCISPSFSPTASNPVSPFTKLLSWVEQKHPVLFRMSVCHYASSVWISHCRCFNLQCSLQSVQARSIWCTDNLQDHTFHRRGKSAFLSQEGATEKSECSDQGAWFQSQRAPGHDPLCYRSDSNIFEKFYSNCDVPAPKKHPVVFPQELAIAYNLKCGILKLKNLIQVYDQICPSGDHCLSNKLWLHKNLLLIMCDNQLYAVPYDLFLDVVHPSQSILTSEVSWIHMTWSLKETQLINKHTNTSAIFFGGSTKW